MPTYRIADMTVRLTPRTPLAEAYFEEYRTDADAVDEDLTVTDAELQAEAGFTPDAPLGVREITASLRKFGQALTLRHDGLLLHAATIVYRGKAFAFIAPSGTGKTTHCRLWVDTLGEQVRILNGDKLIIRRQGDRFFAFGSPWKGKEGFGEQGRYPLGGIVLFHRATDNRIERIAPNEALSALTAATPIPKDAAARLQTLTRLHDITQQTPLFTLFADKHPDAVRAVLAEWEDLT